jgi:hypothetical protein
VNNTITLNYSVKYLLTVVGENIETMLTRCGNLPFFPVIGMVIDTGEGNPRTVIDICWRADIAELAVTFEDEESFSLEVLKGWGWEVL